MIGVGTPDRGDDAAGLEVARRLGDLDGVLVREHSRDGLSLLALLADADAVVLVDAVRSGAAPGAISRYDLGSGPLPTRPPACTTHAIGLQEGLELARALGRLPATVIVYGIEAAALAIGEPVSGPVALAIPALAAQVRAEAMAQAHGRPDDPCSGPPAALRAERAERAHRRRLRQPDPGVDDDRATR